jgi:hypothetical protein
MLTEEEWKEAQNMPEMYYLADKLFAYGLEKGLEKGKKEKAVEMALELHQDGVALAKIVRYTKLTEAEIKAALAEDNKG